VTALELIARLRDKGIRIAARDGELELDAPRGALDAELRADLVRRKPELLRLLSWSRRSARDLPLVPASREQSLPLSWAQQRLWFLDQLEPNSSAYNISWTVRLKGELNTGALQAALDQLVVRHETLRTTFPDENGEPWQHVADGLDIPIERENLAGVSNEQLRVRLGKLAAGPFDLAAGPLLRVTLLRLAAEEFILLVVIHHVVADGASMRVLFRELAALYEAELNGGPAELQPLAIQYADFAVWQRQWLDSEELQRQTDYWLEQLQGLPPLLELPADRPRSAAMRYRGASVLRVLPASLAEELRSLGRGQGSTLFMVMLAAFYVLLMRYSGRHDLVVGTPMGGRPRTGLESLIGFFINTVVLRADLGGDPSFSELLQQVRDVALGAHANQELPFEKLVEVLQPQRELSYSPVFQVMFDLQEEPRWRLPVKNLEVVPEVVFSSRTSSFDLTLSVRQAENGLDAMFEYDTDLFDEGSIERLASHYQALLEEIVANPARQISQFSLTSADEQQRIVATWGAAAADFPATLTLQALFEAQVTAGPDAEALLAVTGEYQYAELNRRSNRLAHRLQALGVVDNTPIALCVSRTPECFVAMLGILKSGGCVMPLDPEYPMLRLEFMLADSGATTVLVAPENEAVVAPLAGENKILVLNTDVFESPDYPDENPTSLAGPESLAFLMYTSGSTGKPKGVGLAHRGLVNYIHQLGQKTALSPHDRVLQFASPSFDICIEETFAAWLHGATLVLRDSGMNLSADEFFAGCERHAISWLSLPTAWWHELCGALESGERALPASLRSVTIGGEKARLEAFALWKQAAANIRLLNTYGPTETSIAATWYELTHLDPATCGELPIGHPVPNVFAWVLDEHLRPLPAGVPGELYIGGVGVASGYWRRHEQSAERFVADPFTDHPEARLYRTGDRARYLADGRLVFLGRMDGQVKIRGHRIEPGEIETAITAIDGVSSCVVTLHETPAKALAGAADKLLIAYVIGTIGTGSLREELRNLLPDYMLPGAFVRLEKFPLTVNGKLDYRALPEPEFARDETLDYVAPRNETEQRLAQIWADVLGIPRVGVFDNFFALGGHSLLATRVVSRVRDALAATVPLRELFDSPTVAGFAKVLAVNVSSDDSARLMPRDPATRLLPLSWAQQRLWVLDQLEPHSVAYNLPWVARVTGGVDQAALQNAVDILVGRHESLRTGFGGREGEPVQLIASRVQIPVQVEQLADVTETDVQTRLQELISIPFDLHKPPLMRVHLLRIAQDESVLLLLMHHIVADGWSMGVLFRELAHCYNRLRLQKPVSLTELPVQYADFAIWQRGRLTGSELGCQESYWETQLANAPPVLELPFDYPRPPVQSFRGAWVSTTINQEVLDGLHALAAREGATLFMVLLGVFNALLAIQTGKQDVIVGTPIAGRLRTELEGLIGCFLNTLVLRTQLHGDPDFRELLCRIRQTTLDAYEHQELPFEKLLEVLQPTRTAAYTPIVQVMFNLQNAPTARLEFDELQVESFELDRGTAKFDLSAVLVEGRDGLRIGFEYNTDLFAPATVEEMLDQYGLMLEKVVADPQISLAELVRTRAPLVPALPTVLLPDGDDVDLDALSWDVQGGALMERFQAIVALYPEQIAVQDGESSWTYRDLDAWANNVAQLIGAADHDDGGNVGLMLGHDAQMVAGLLGVLQAGCAYVPLDRRAPAARLRSIIADAGMRVVLSDGTNDDLLQNADLTVVEVPARPDFAAPVSAVVTAPDDLAYVLFTSGSTGAPKGVMQTRRNVLHHARAYSEALGLNAGDRLTLLSSYGFDAAVMDIFGALLNGACLVPIDILATADSRGVLESISDSAITVLHSTPTVFRYLLCEDERRVDLRAVRAVVLGGEEATASDFELFKAAFPESAVFINGLGPSESTTALQFRADRRTCLSGKIVPVGLPVRDTEVVLLDDTGKVSAISGELCIRSDYVSSGYWGLPELTAERFGSDVSGCPGRLYRSGDRARYLPDGQLAFLGRLDDQVKVRGHRVELAEVEQAIKSAGGVERCAVVLQSGPAANDEAEVKLLVAYVQGAVDVSRLRSVLQELLPDYMLPAVFMKVDALPLLANGKLDRHALPRPDWSGAPSVSYQAPATEIERQLYAIWSEVMGRGTIGIHDDFFELGGHSLMATRVVARVRDGLGVELSLRELFAAPTIAGLAVALGAVSGSDGSAPVLRAQTAGELPPLSWAQQRLWFLDQLEPDSAAYNLHWAARLDGVVSVAGLQAAINALLARHDSLRTTFSSSDGDAGKPVQVISPYAEVPLQEEVFAGASEERLHSRLLELIHQPFDLQLGPLLRAHLLQLAEAQSLLLLTTHHIVSDGWSMGVLVRELAAMYNSHTAPEGALVAAPPAPANLPELPVQYADYAVWQRAWLSGGELERQEAYWKTQLADVPPILDLPLDHARPPVQRFRGAWVSETLSRELSAELHELAAGAGATLFMVLLAAFKVLVMRHTGREDIVIGAPIAGRRRTELEGLIGFFLNTLVLRSDLAGNPAFSEVIARVKQTMLGAYEHQELPFEKLLEILQPTRSTAYTPVVQIMFNLHNEPGGAMDLHGVSVKPFSMDRGTAKFDLSVAVVESKGELQIGFEYNTDLFDRETVARLLRHFGEILAVVARDPQLSVADMPLSAAPLVQLPPQRHSAVSWEGESVRTLTGRFAEIANLYSSRLAISTGADSWTYRELDDWSTNVARLLHRHIASGSRIGLLLGHDAEMVAGLLGVLKAGCSYVPLDREAPATRINAIINEAGVTAVLTSAEYRGVLDGCPGPLPMILDVPEQQADGNTVPDNASGPLVQPDDLAYILFTSGSTGKPKGVMQNHRNVLHHVRTYTNSLQINAEDRLSLFSTYGFDASIMDIFGALLNGACLCPLDIRSHEHPGEMLDLMEGATEHPGVSILHATPTVLRFLMRHKVCRHDLSAVRLVVLGGEEARPSDFALFKRHFAPPAIFVNGLGPSESTLATQFFADHQTQLPGQIVPVGSAVEGTRVVLLNEDGSEAGVSGELAIRSSHVSLGYWQHPELTSERFLPDPTEEEPGRYLYRTGDRVRMLPDGQLVYLGRIDGQLKVRGHRIEPGEIEAQLAAMEGVNRCVVLMHSGSPDGGSGDARLVAYVVLQEDDAAAELDTNVLRRHLRTVLPDYMVPQVFMLVDELPLLPNGKVDKSALPAPDWTRDETQIYVHPRTETERQLAGIWSDILGVSNVGVHDDFFELGGHSLMAAQLVARVTESMQVGLPLRRLFDTPTIAGIAEHVDALQWALHN